MHEGRPVEVAGRVGEIVASKWEKITEMKIDLLYFSATIIPFPCFNL